MHVSGITFTEYAQNRKVGKPNNLKFWEQKIKVPQQDGPKSAMVTCFEYTKGLSSSCKSKKNRQNNGKKKKEQKDKH